MSKIVPLHQVSATRDAKGTTIKRGKEREGERQRDRETETETERERETQVREKMAMNKYQSIIIISINGLNDSIKRHNIPE